MAATFYLIHGWTLKAHTAALATLAALMLTAALAGLSVGVARLSGLGSEEALFLTQFADAGLNVRGLLLASILIGALGVLDDLTINQISAVFELRQANPDLSLRSLYRRAMVIGQVTSRPPSTHWCWRTSGPHFRSFCCSRSSRSRSSLR